SLSASRCPSLRRLAVWLRSRGRAATGTSLTRYGRQARGDAEHAAANAQKVENTRVTANLNRYLSASSNNAYMRDKINE
ncbi:unnamed protein product, partial [Urochloa humidicola]